MGQANPQTAQGRGPGFCSHHQGEAHRTSVIVASVPPQWLLSYELRRGQLTEQLEKHLRTNAVLLDLGVRASRPLYRLGRAGGFRTLLKQVTNLCAL